MVIRTQDLKVLFRAQDVIGQLVVEGLAVVPRLDPAIDLARDRLETQKGRQHYMLDMLPDSIAYAIPGVAGQFVVQFPHAGRIELLDGIPVLTQLMHAEQQHGERAIQLIHDPGLGLRNREYWL